MKTFEIFVVILLMSLSHNLYAQVDHISVYEISFSSCNQEHHGLIILDQQTNNSFARIVVDKEYLIEESISIEKSDKKDFQLKLVCKNPKYVPSDEICLGYSADNFYLDTLNLKMINVDNSFRKSEVKIKRIENSVNIKDLNKSLIDELK